MYGKFDLIQNVRVEPKFDEKQRIPVLGTFILPKNCSEYHFNLVQDEYARKMQYEAVVKNPSFPLNQDVECDLIMTYQYGAEEPYELVFVPKDPRSAGFSEAKTNWYKLDQYRIDGLKAPKFPEKLPWDTFYRYPNIKGGFINVFEELEDLFKQINNGYYTKNLSGTFMSQNKDGDWHGNFPLQKDGEEINVKWSQSDWDKDLTPPQKITDISFWLKPEKPKKQYW